MANKELFGGAITTYIPENFIDVSDIREVPDNQEVFVNIDTDQSIIIEILQYVGDLNEDEKAIRHHFASIASDNNAEEYNSIQQIITLTTSDVPNLSLEISKYLLSGQQTISKFNESDPNSRNLVNIFMALFRLPNIETDIVITYNIPILIGITSSSKQIAQEGNLHEGMEVFKRILVNFEIKNWELFNE
ncbi:hypothetical protein Glove_390g18 [Diversispora epigaea]|uniref:Ran guanine nucleotide release factor n=1 Tax=Diversispora epigaea TaxID=1348612 RepID=A0A397H6K2_9GLOM|nr:hypothetical protein Glove_390g18 [Diversispora epigaea]